ncbi:CV_2116 domain-containing protein [Marinobacter sp. Arc7-DN-1]|jgi:hypothetical protein|uniref:CV_2116 domain-containing protein n=1 Tax=Marinobacter sp. Arc7-DN-1 TaxID=2304594 RepID=UPI000E434805|nr:hypothetical protein [Marinobacter sp. Arc7-DN-1]AXS81593.1 hypothetical protein D0851_00020 [Marinobacter sp. Arc7-DN-1]
MNRTTYKAFELLPIPYQLADTNEWVVRVSIVRHHDARAESLEKTVSASKKVKSLGEAERLSLEFGKEVVDGKYPNISLDDLS